MHERRTVMIFTNKELEKCIDFAKKMEGNHKSDMIMERDVWEIFRDDLRGKLGEIAVHKYLCDKLGTKYNLNEIDFSVLERGKWDTTDLEVEGKFINVKAIRHNASFLLIETKRYNRYGEYCYANNDGKKVPLDIYALVRLALYTEKDNKKIDFNEDDYKNIIESENPVATLKEGRTISAEILGGINHKVFWKNRKTARRGIVCTKDNLAKVWAGETPERSTESGDKNYILQTNNYFVPESEMSPLEDIIRAKTEPLESTENMEFDEQLYNEYSDEKRKAVRSKDPRKKAIKNIDESYLVEAGAGSGKTTVMVARMISMIEQGVPGEEICALTFTNAAAEEMEGRFIRILDIRSKEILTSDEKKYICIYEKYLGKSNLLTRKRCEDAEGWYIGTLDKFILDLANSNVEKFRTKISGVDKKTSRIIPLTNEKKDENNGKNLEELIRDFYRKLIDSETSDKIKLRLFHAYNGNSYSDFSKYEKVDGKFVNLDEYYGTFGPVLHQPLTGPSSLFANHAEDIFVEIMKIILNNIDYDFAIPAEEKQAYHYNNEIQSIKNRLNTIISNNENSVINPMIFKMELDDTFFKSLKSYLTARNSIGNKYPYIYNNTFLYAYNGTVTADSRTYEMTADQIAVIRGFLKWCIASDFESKIGKADRESLREIYNDFEKIRYSYSVQYVNDRISAFRLEQFNSETNILSLTFPEIHKGVMDMLKDERRRSNGIFENLQYKYFCIDEFQDTSPMQMDIVKYLAGIDEYSIKSKKESNKAGSIFIVGDPKQSIYHFRGADIRCYLEVRDFFEDSFEILNLPENNRSSKNLIDYYNRVFPDVFKRNEYNTQCNYGDGMKYGKQAETGSDDGVTIYSINNLVGTFRFNGNSDDISDLSDIIKNIIAKNGLNNVMVLSSESPKKNKIVGGFYNYLEEICSDLNDEINVIDDTEEAEPAELIKDKLNFMTIHKSKGLEADAVIVFDPDQMFYRSEHSCIRSAVNNGKGYIFDYLIKDTCFHDFNNHSIDENPYVHTIGEDQLAVYKDEYDIELNALLEENHRKMYVAATRARKTLLIITRDPAKDTCASEKMEYLYK